MREHIQKAHEIQQATTGQYRALMMMLKEEESKIGKDATLSELGRKQKIAELKKQHGRQLMQFAKQAKDDYQTEVIRAKGKAERFLENPNKKPDDAAVKKYERGLAELKTRVLLSTRADRAAEMISEFAKGIEDPYIANQFRDQYAEVITPIIPQADGTVKSNLSKLYDKLESDFITDEQREAKQIIEQADSMFSAKLFNPTVIDNVKDSYDRRVADYINTPDTFFHLEKVEAEKEQE
ncbi:hypothetical protein BABA_17387 [Neobacillus bataviensis LMG 21833]|uniref:Uncharacterized protein n=1 Tax=Neobacillus bataviensis LMG 21833 TaxID=1117379 RepID=K6DCN7_9BACI|nr:hypothetical protein [Neobacillus bataviensis]EKN66039.1 hypothetical protein BABA_17387 [Neobacillus bataviensis LMG 21833]